MRYLHFIIDANNNQTESVYSINNNPKLSLQCAVGTYKIWDRETNEVEIVN